MQIVELETEIRPCPFCGSEAIVKTDQTPPCSEMNEHFWVKCSNADCSVSPKSHPKLEVAIARWNTRAQ
jgi:Lar family restriction alleviation protein